MEGAWRTGRSCYFVLRGENLASHWHIEKTVDPLDRRTYVGIVGLAFFGFGLWYLAETMRMSFYGLIVGGCAGLAAVLLFADLFGWIRLRSPTLREVIVTPTTVTLNAGHVHQTVRLHDVVRIEIRIQRGYEPLLVLVADDKLFCGIPRAAWQTLDVEKRLRTLQSVRWERMGQALAAVGDRSFVLWQGAAGDAMAFGADSPA